MKNALIILLLATLAACIAGGGWMLSRPNPASAELARLESDLKSARAEIGRLKGESARLNAAPRRRALISAPPVAGGAIPATTPDGAAPGPDKPAAGPAGKSGANAFREMMKAPGMKEMMKQQTLAQMDMLYGRLFASFELNPEERENFKQLLAARTGAQTEMGLKMMDENLTPEQKKQITADYEAAKKVSDESIKTFLGNDEDYKTYQHWEDTQPERMAVEMMGGRSHFATAGEPLSPDQEQKLVDVMAAVRKAPSTVPDLSKPENVWGRGLSDEMIQQQLEKFDRDASTVAQNAAGFMSATQLTALGKMQQQFRSMAEAGMKMSNAMMKGGK